MENKITIGYVKKYERKEYINAAIKRHSKAVRRQRQRDKSPERYKYYLQEK